MLGILVKQDDSVAPGQLIATIDDAAGAAAVDAFGGAPGAGVVQHRHTHAGADYAAAGADYAAAGADGGGGSGGDAPAAAAAVAGRVPGIRFPPRVTPDGVRISSLPAAEAADWAARLAGGGGGSAAAAAAPAAPAVAASAASAGAPAVAAAAKPAAAPKPASGVTTTRLGRAPARTPLTDRELEAIMLGGALD